MRRFVSFSMTALCIAAVTQLVSGSRAYAQGITLPSTRTIGPSAAVQYLVRMVDEADLWLKSDQPGYEGLQMVRYRLLLAPFRQEALETIAANPTTETIWAALYDRELRAGNRDVMMAVRKSVQGTAGLDPRAQSALLVFALTGEELTETSGDLEIARANLFRQVDQLSQARRDSSKPVASVTETVRSLTTAPHAKKPPRVVSETEAIYLPSIVAEKTMDGELKARLDSLGRLARLVVIERKLDRGWFPVHSTEQARVFWRQRGFSPLNVGALTGSGTAGAAYTELASPLLHAIRLSLNTVLATSENNDDDSSGNGEANTGGDETELTRFLNGGGQVNVGAALPAYSFGTRNGAFSFLALLAPRVGATVGALGAVESDRSAFIDPAVELHLGSSDASERVGFFAQLRSGYAAGGRDFGEALGLEGGDRAFAYANAAVGLVFADRYLLSAGRSIAGPKPLQRLGWQVGITVIRSPQ